MGGLSPADSKIDFPETESLPRLCPRSSTNLTRPWRERPRSSRFRNESNRPLPPPVVAFIDKADFIFMVDFSLWNDPNMPSDFENVDPCELDPGSTIDTPSLVNPSLDSVSRKLSSADCDFAFNGISASNLFGRSSSSPFPFFAFEIKASKRSTT